MLVTVESLTLRLEQVERTLRNARDECNRSEKRVEQLESLELATDRLAAALRLGKHLGNGIATQSKRERDATCGKGLCLSTAFLSSYSDGRFASQFYGDAMDVQQNQDQEQDLHQDPRAMEIDARLLDRLLNSALDVAIESSAAAQEVVSSKKTKTCENVVTGDDNGASSDSRDPRLPFKTSVAAHLLSLVDGTYQWPKALLVALYAKGKTQSSELIDVLSRMVPTLPCNARLHAALGSLISSLVSAQHTLCTLRRDRHVHFNNLGDYSKKTAYSGQESALVTSIITTVEVFYQRPTASGNFLQGEELYSPGVWQQRQPRIDEYWQLQTMPIHNGLDDSDGGVIDICGIIGELEEYREEKGGYIGRSAAQFRTAKGAGSLQSVEARARELAAQETAAQTAATKSNSEIEAQPRKTCDQCGLHFNTACYKCACGGNLVRYEHEDPEALATKFQVICTKSDRARISDSTNDNGKQIIITTTFNSSTGTVTVAKGTLTSAHAASSASGPLAQADVGFEAMDIPALTMDREIVRELLPPIMVNPNTQPALKSILEKVGAWADVVGFGEPGSKDTPSVPTRWVCVGFDRGANPKITMDKLAQQDEKWHRFHLVPDAGHTFFALMRLVLELLWVFGAGKFAQDFGFSKEASAGYLESGKNTHKTLQFIDCVAEALHRACFQQFALDRPNVSDEIFDAEFRQWLDDDEGDESFQSFRFVIENILPALRLVLKGQRTNAISMFMAGCKLLLPFLFMTGKVVYGRGVIDELRDLYRMDKELLEMRIVNFSPLGQPFGLKLEETNSEIKQARTGSSSNQWYTGVILVDLMRHVLGLFFSMLGLKQAKSGKTRTEVLMHRDVRDMQARMVNWGTWKKRAGNTKTFCFDRKTELRPGSALQTLRDVGLERISAWNTNLSDPHQASSQTFPPRHYFTQEAMDKAALSKQKAQSTKKAKIDQINARIAQAANGDGQGQEKEQENVEDLQLMLEVEQNREEKEHGEEEEYALE